MSEQEIETGDRVRVTYEGIVTRATPYNFDLDDSACFARTYGSKIRSVEILEKRKPQVGDVINSRRDLGSLPGGSVVTNRLGHALIVRHGRTYAPELYFAGVDSEFVNLNPGNPPYRVIYIP